MEQQTNEAKRKRKIVGKNNGKERVRLRVRQRFIGSTIERIMERTIVRIIERKRKRIRVVFFRITKDEERRATNECTCVRVYVLSASIALEVRYARGVAQVVLDPPGAARD